MLGQLVNPAETTSRSAVFRPALERLFARLAEGERAAV